MPRDVPKPLRRSIVLIVDDDLGFVCWLGDILAEMGYQAVPASDSRQATAFIRDLHLQVDFVIVNPGLPGISEMIQTLSRPSPKIVAIRNPATEVTGAIQAQATLERPSSSDPLSRQEWLKKVRRVLRKALGTLRARRAGARPT